MKTLIQTLLDILSKQQFGFVDIKKDLCILEADMPDLPLLIRCGAERYVVKASAVKAKMEQVEKEGDYVRDVSLPAKLIDDMKASPCRYVVPAHAFFLKQAIQEMRW